MVQSSNFKGLFDGDRRAHDRARAGDAKASVSACAVATGLLGCAFREQTRHGQAITSCPFVDCPDARSRDAHLTCATEGPSFACSCGLRKGDTIELVRAVSGRNFRQAVAAIADLAAGAFVTGDDETGRLL